MGQLCLQLMLQTVSGEESTLRPPLCTKTKLREMPLLLSVITKPACYGQVFEAIGMAELPARLAS